MVFVYRTLHNFCAKRTRSGDSSYDVRSQSTRNAASRSSCVLDALHSFLHFEILHCRRLFVSSHADGVLGKSCDLWLRNLAFVVSTSDEFHIHEGRSTVCHAPNFAFWSLYHRNHTSCILICHGGYSRAKMLHPGHSAYFAST